MAVNGNTCDRTTAAVRSLRSSGREVAYVTKQHIAEQAEPKATDAAAAGVTAGAGPAARHRQADPRVGKRRTTPACRWT